ncbi:MAG: hypothetical protein A3K22_00980 [Deltaproteobacteria bacterium RBG_16_42_7]|nr:MAG: hypothetical protein A3K22_00980 [Deltaproteobacteria bacterium RBG_16_42_7]
MPDTIQQQIINAIDARFKTITIANGYNTELGADKVFEWRETPIYVNNLPVLTYRDTANEKIENGPIGFFRWSLTIEIEVEIASGAATLSNIRNVVADILKAAGTDKGTWNGLAEYTEQPSSALMVKHEENKIAGVKITFSVIYDAPAWQV